MGKQNESKTITSEVENAEITMKASEGVKKQKNSGGRQRKEETKKKLAKTKGKVV